MRTPVLDLPRRLPVWVALSDLYLDTELDGSGFRRIADALVQSGYTDEELQAILLEEVHPVCIPNLLSMVGEWEGFDPEELQRRILANQRRPWKKWFISRVGRSMVQGHWRTVMSLVHEQRAQADQQSGPKPDG